MLSISCNYRTLCWKWKTVWVYESRLIVKVSLLIPVTTRPTGSCARCPARHHRDRPTHTASPGKDQNSTFKERFLLNAFGFCTITKLKTCNSNHHESGTCVCTHFLRIYYVASTRSSNVSIRRSHGRKKWYEHNEYLIHQSEKSGHDEVKYQDNHGHVGLCRTVEEGPWMSFEKEKCEERRQRLGF